MTLMLLTITTLFRFHTNANIDTIDYWHVKYNDKTIAEYTFYDKAPIRIKRAEIKFSDKLAVDYGNDTPGDEHDKGLYIIDNNKKRLTITTGKDLETLKVSLYYILAVKVFHNLKNLDFYYFDKKRDHFIFRLIIE